MTSLRQRPDHLQLDDGDTSIDARFSLLTTAADRDARNPGDQDGADTPVPAAVRRRRVPPPRRGPALLLALVLGGLVALLALPGGLTGNDLPVARAAGYALGASDAGLMAAPEDVNARQEISAVEAQARLAQLNASRAARTPQFVLPTDGHLSTCFCMRWGQMHWGIDLAAPLGTPIYAAAEGVVLRAGPATGYGNAIYIQDADGNVEIYGHMRYYDVRAGDIVSAGELIAKVGKEGQSTGPHLHFQIDQGSMNGKPIDPQKWLADRGITVG